MRKMTNKKGFTLMEMLIVVAIIAILVAIAIPTVTSALENSRESTDAANIRAAYAEIMTMSMTGEQPTNMNNGSYTITYTGGKYTATIALKQKKDEWQNKTITNIAGQSTTTDPLKAAGSGETVKIEYDEATNVVTWECAGKKSDTTSSVGGND